VALRLCNRFGSGPRCHINKLPVELISTIERSVVESARVKAFNAWSSYFRCFELKCDTLDDHFTHEEQHDMYHHYMLDTCPGRRFCSFHRKLEPASAARRKALLGYVKEMQYWDEPHDSKTQGWATKIDTEGPSCIFTKHQALVRSHFGIDIWILNVRLPPLSNNTPGVDWWKQDQDHNTTLAYLTMPNNVPLQKNWAKVGDYDFETGFAMPLTLGAVPTEASLRRFPRAMHILSLEVFSQSTQAGALVSALTNQHYSNSVDTVDDSTASWPQLTLLTKCRLNQQ
jgi:hypothetical protein